ncbi:prenyltransferase/squalene oxidase repeat-containing protein [Isosphaeraceae bacterium EP7]
MRRQRSRTWRLVRARGWLLARRLNHLDRRWLHGIPSWGTSLALHAVVLMALALIVLQNDGGRREPAMELGFPGTLTDSLDSLLPADIAGDPFNDAMTPDAPSLSIENASEVRDSNQPDLPPETRIAANLAGPMLAPGAMKTGRLSVTNLSIQPGRLSDGISMGAMTAEAISAPFSGRQGPARAELVRREGGTVQSEKAVESGLDWLARHQRGDGGWSLQYQGQCVAPGCPQTPSMDSDTAATGLALLPMLGSGHSHMAKGRYQIALRRGLQWIISNQKRDGDLFTGGAGTAQFYSHAIATMALCEAYGLTQDKSLRAPAQKAINFIIRSQNPDDGGWRYFPGSPGDTSVFGWQMMALRSARLAGLELNKNVLARCKRYLDLAAVDETKVTYAYMPGRVVTPVMTAEALLTRQYLGWPRDFPALLKGVALVSADLEESQERNIYYWYYATQLLHNMHGKAWDVWNARVRDGLVSMQMGGGGCDRGSWNPREPEPDRWGAAGGRLYVTALSLLTLEVYYRYLPLYRVNDPKADEVAKATAKDAPAEAKKDEPAKKDMDAAKPAAEVTGSK